jgi:NTP pyrophosphatase (non-canonical NTP hydrolase)
MSPEQDAIQDQKARMDQLARHNDKSGTPVSGLDASVITIQTVHGVKQDVVFNSYPENMTIEETETLESLVKSVQQWHRDRNLIDGSTDKDQTLKLLQELGELSDSVCKEKDIKDDIGDMLVVMINIATRNNVSLLDCLARAWDDIKDRKGKMVDGIFVKEGD